MKVPKTLADRDELINHTINGIIGIIKRKGVEKDRRGQWFANSQLDNLRQLLERKGYQTARIFQAGKIEKKGNKWEVARNEALLDILDLLGKDSNKLDLIICSYLLGKLNSIIDETLAKGGVK